MIRGTGKTNRAGNRAAPCALPTEKQKRGGYVARFVIPDTSWSATDTIQTEKRRAIRRHDTRESARKQWSEMKRAGLAWKVDRFIALIEVAYPRMRNVVPARAAETVKPIIDAGTDAGLWEDDNSNFRCATVFFQSPVPPPPHSYCLTVYIIPVPGRNPQYNIQGALPLSVLDMWDDDESRPEWDDGYAITFQVPHRLWITSNFTDSDVKARQTGAYKSETWGDGMSFGVRQQVESELEKWALGVWLRKNYCGYERFIVMAGIGYASGVDADPDNAAETVNAILHAGIRAGAWRGLSNDYCKATVFFRSPMSAAQRKHDVVLYIIPVPCGFHIAETLASSSENAWVEYDRRWKR